MRKLDVSIEIKGEQILAGHILGDSPADARFIYDKDFISNSSLRPISISLPFQEDAFSPEKTKTFFEALLPEGFSRRSVAAWLKADENDYLTILEGLGKECLGAIQINSADSDGLVDSYEELSMEQVKALAAEGATKSTEILMETHLSLTGASGKVGLYYDEKSHKWFLPKGNAASSHIVKQSHVRLKKIVYNEQLCMLTAKKIGLDVPKSKIINIGSGNDDEVLFATRRYDRKPNNNKLISGLPSLYRLHQEDFGQALAIPAADKYEKENSGYLAKMFEIIRDYSSDPIADHLKLWDTIIFDVLVGNTDCHVKNFSLLYSEDFQGLRLAPVYDIVNTLSYGATHDMSFYIGDEIDITKMTRDTFKKAASQVGLSERIALQHYDNIKEKFDSCLEEAKNELGQFV